MTAIFVIFKAFNAQVGGSLNRGKLLLMHNADDSLALKTLVDSCVNAGL